MTDKWFSKSGTLRGTWGAEYVTIQVGHLNNFILYTNQKKTLSKNQAQYIWVSRLNQSQPGGLKHEKRLL